MKHLILTLIVLFQTSAFALDRVGGPIGIPEFAKVPVPQEKLELLQIVGQSEEALAHMLEIRQRGMVFTSATTQATEWGDVIYTLKFSSIDYRC